MSTKISPRLPKPRNRKITFYENIPYGGFFIYKGLMCIRIDDIGSYEQLAVDVNSGEILFEMCGEEVIPVDVELKWKKIDVPKE